MADSASPGGEETPSQRQARLRREKREAKIKAGGSERLDKITKLSGRTPESMRRESGPSSPPISVPGTPTPQSQPRQPPLANTSDPAQARAQEEYLRTLLRQPTAAEEAQQQQPGQGDDASQDPMIKMLESMLGPISQVGGDPNAPDANTPLQLDPSAIANATGLPPFLVNQFLGGVNQTPQTPAQAKAALRWKIVHILFSLAVGFYVLFSIGRAVELFGTSEEVGLKEELPAPATMRNPWWVFILGEVLLGSAKAVLSGQGEGVGKKGIWEWFQVLKDLGRDGSVVVFVMGVASLCGSLGR